jgi:hypothetical protein
MFNVYDFSSISFAFVSAIVMAIPVFNRPPKYPDRKELIERPSKDNVITLGVGESAVDAFEKLEKESYKRWRSNSWATAIGLALLTVSLLFQLVANSIG